MDFEINDDGEVVASARETQGRGKWDRRRGRYVLKKSFDLMAIGIGSVDGSAFLAMKEGINLSFSLSYP
ncbi:unnamed protein product [Linum trigynum]|uniref:Uncharacterized protein n=1 Tax=Linum trigynum TaxID=586398 RepID=A0AAV2G9W7_9ROSI